MRTIPAIGPKRALQSGVAVLSLLETVQELAGLEFRPCENCDGP
jgi:hypothetical protein